MFRFTKFTSLFCGRQNTSFCNGFTSIRARNTSADQNALFLVKEISKVFQCEEAKAKKLYEDYSILRSPDVISHFKQISATVKQLLAFGVKIESMLERDFGLITNIASGEPNKQPLVKEISKIFWCDETKATKIYDDYPLLRSGGALESLEQNVELSLDNGVSMMSALENVFILTLGFDILQEKFLVLFRMKPRKVDDFFPLLKLNHNLLVKMADTMEKERHSILGGNRIYYISQKLKVEPKIVAKSLLQPSVLFDGEFEHIQKITQILCDYGVKESEILQNWSIYNQSDRKIIDRLDRMLSAGILPSGQLMASRTKGEFETRLKKTEKVIDPAILQSTVIGRNKEKAAVVSTIQSMLDCEFVEASVIYYNQINRIDQLDDAEENVKFLVKNNVNLVTIRKSPNVLAMSLLVLEENLKILQELKPKNIDDIFPLIEVDTKKLEEHRQQVIDECATGANHPVYGLSEKIKIPPNKIALYLAKYIQMLGTSRNLVDKCDFLFGNGIVLEDCDISESVEYLANRLQWDESDMENSWESYSFLEGVQLSQTKQIADFLLQHFPVQEINANLKIFERNFDETNDRFEELRSIGEQPIKLETLTLDNDEYLQYVQNKKEDAKKEPRDE